MPKLVPLSRIDAQLLPARFVRAAAKQLDRARPYSCARAGGGDDPDEFWMDDAFYTGVMFPGDSFFHEGD